MKLPNHVAGGSDDDKLAYLVERLKKRTKFQPGKRYKLNVRESHATATLRDKHPEFFQDTGLLKRTEHWTLYEPVQYIRLPRRQNAPRGTTAIEDLRTKDDFEDWFTDQFPSLPDGVYGGIQRKGHGNGTSTLFVCKLQNGRITDDGWRKKSSNQAPAKDGSASQYYVLPLFFKWRRELGV